MNTYKYTAEELLTLSETKERLENYGDEHLIKLKIKNDLARTKNYKENIFYYATGGTGESGVGEGLYLGCDKRVLNNFYNSDGTYGKIKKYIGTPSFIDLADYADFDEFEKQAIEKFGKQKNNTHLKLLILLKGYDGIRYYDPIATGEEYVLFNTEKVSIFPIPKKSHILLESIVL
jgi:hypothetical protein